jgi:hypothetical protein
MILVHLELRPDSGIAAPAANRKKAQIRSAGVHPSHAACASGQYTWPASPGLLTITIAAIATPRSTSSESTRPRFPDESGELFVRRSAGFAVGDPRRRRDEGRDRGDMKANTIPL